MFGWEKVVVMVQANWSCVCLDRLGRDQEEEDGDEIG